MAQAIIFNATTKYFGETALGLYRPAGAYKFASVLRERGYDVEVVEFLNYWQIDDIKKFLKNHCNAETLFIGWSTSFFNIKKGTYDELIDWVRTNYPHIKLIAGGYQPTFANLNNLDYYIYSYAEGVIDDLMNHIKGLPNNLKTEPMNEGRSLFVDCLRDYRLNDWGNPKINYAPSDFIWPEECLTIELSRGCVFQCKFCSFPITNKKGIDHIRTEESLYQELQSNYDLYGTTSYIISDETVNDSIVKLEALRNAVKRLSFKPDFSGFFRVDLIYTYPQSIQLLKECNVVGMHFGIETFHHKSGIAIGKGLAPDKVKATLQRIREEMGPDVNTMGSFIVGLPYEPIDSLYETLAWLEKPDCPLTSWLWFGLDIPNSKAKLQTSYFSNNFQKYGYESLGVCKENEKSIHWKLPYLDYYSAYNLSLELLKKSANHRRVDPWHIVAFKGLAIDQKEYVNRTYEGPNTLNYDYLYSVTTKKVNDYIHKKLSL
ncbi:MAG: B12-binding domain-containing radical SAM protein [Pseudobdellovibrio sp.]